MGTEAGNHASLFFMTTDDYKRLPRLYIPRETITGGESVELSEGQHHYLRNVMRAKAGDGLRLFNGRNGEWLGEITEISKKKAIASISQKIHEQQSSPDVWVLASPVKKEAFDFMVEKSTELGASRFLPVTCEHTVVHRVNQTRLQAVSIEAAEQSERLDIMEMADLSDLKNYLNSWDSSRKLIFCFERGEAPPLVQALTKIPADTPLAVLVGPEGGFSAEEAAFIAAQDYAVPVSLGPRILKAETALVAAMACIQGVRGG